MLQAKREVRIRWSCPMKEVALHEQLTSGFVDRCPYLCCAICTWMYKLKLQPPVHSLLTQTVRGLLYHTVRCTRKSHDQHHKDSSSTRKTCQWFCRLMPPLFMCYIQRFNIASFCLQTTATSFTWSTIITYSTCRRAHAYKWWPCTTDSTTVGSSQLLMESPDTFFGAYCTCIPLDT